MKKLWFVSVLIILFLSIQLQSQEKKNTVNAQDFLGEPSYSFLNKNNISTIFYNDGISDNKDQLARFRYPRSTGKTTVFQSGFLWGTLIPGDPQPRVGGSVYRTGLEPGKILNSGLPWDQLIGEDPNAAHVRIYRVRSDVYPGGPPVDLSVEASEEGKTEAEIRLQYEQDWTEWRAVDGAPFEDINGDGIYDPAIDIPGVKGASQTIWFVANDLNSGKTTNLYGTLPIGVEYQATYWNYLIPGYLSNLLFRKYKLINKSNTPFNDMYVSMWSDTDVGSSNDDFAGCDSTLNFVFGYNAYDHDPDYAPLPPPAVGFTLVEGPKNNSGEPMNMTAAYYFSINGGPTQGDPQGAIQFYNSMQGKMGITGEPIINPVTLQPTSFALSGDPLTGEGWLDGMILPAGDRRVGFGSGPFNMAPGDTQVVIIAEIAAIGEDRLSSFRNLKYYSALTGLIDQNDYEYFGAPFPPAPEVSVTGTEWTIDFNWGLDSASVSEIENFNEDGFEFQGYNVYQLPYPEPFMENAVKIATYDLEDGITHIPGLVMDPVTGLPVNGILHSGTDSGLEHQFSTRHDAIENTNMLIGKKYYFAVTAYTFNPDTNSFIRSTESVLNIFEAVYYDSLNSIGHGDSIDVIHSQGNGDGNVYVTIYDPTKLTNSDYEVFFVKQAYYRDSSGEWIPIIPGKNSNLFESPDTLTGSTLDITAVYGPTGTLDCHFKLNLVSPNNAWADGIKIVFPPSTSVTEAPTFLANGGWVEPVIEGNIVSLGEVNNAYTQNGIFHGDEEWRIQISFTEPSFTVGWTIYDDGYPDPSGAVNAVGETNIDSIANDYKVQDEWNLLNLTTQDTVLKRQTIVNGYDIYTGEYTGDPIIEGFEIKVDANYDSPLTYGSVRLNNLELGPVGEPGEPGTSWRNENWNITDYTLFGFETGTSFHKNGYGTLDPDILRQDYEFRWTGIEEVVNINGQNVVVIQDGTGSVATLYGARFYDLGNHPLNPSPGSLDPFLVRIPFEVWNLSTNEQINYQFYDRSQNDPSLDSFKVWNTDARMYAEILNTPYDPAHIANGQMGGSDTSHYTWMNVWYESNWTTGDEIKTEYLMAVTSEDKFIFSTPAAISSVKNELLPDQFFLFQNYPNPFNPMTTIRFNIAEQSLVKLEVYDILGQRVTQLVNSELSAGTHEVRFNASHFASGIYFYTLNVKDKFFKVKKMILVK